MQTGALRKATSRPRLEKLHRGGNVVVDARDRFIQKRPVEPPQASPTLPLPESGMLAPMPRAVFRPKRPVSPLTHRVELDHSLAFVLTREGVDQTDGMRCLLYTVIPAPVDEADDERYLKPYLERGWEKLFRGRGQPGSSGTIEMRTSPYATFCRGFELLDFDNRVTVNELIAGGLRHVPDPLAR
ncbi:hypothetical protein HZC53_04480 [Candidatus Uhrbacteria bacterium]|nr:hypothetical protein [Candidatus Uhrbacteria bacterium]